CTEDYTSGTPVTLTPAPDTGSVFTGWSGDPDCSDGAVTMDAGKTCTATFNLQNFTLTVTKAGSGGGTVTSSPAGIDCGSDCTEDYTSGTPVTLTPEPDTGSTFVGWSGVPDCSDGIVTMDAAMNCTASFTLNQYTLTTSVTPAGNGSVNPDCSAGCIYDYGTVVVINAIDYSGYPFIDWTDCESPSGSNCTMTITADKGATAEFDVCMYDVKRTGSGTGYYDFLQDAYDSASGSDIIYSQYVTLPDLNIDFNSNITVTLEGGYNCDYSGITGSTVINGNMTVSDGTVIVQSGTVEVQ
ncbi:MAG: InlB B-repeat-containing protein, partial [Nitrospiraceae bacterium]